MRERRSGSQILFGHLPDQTIDADGGIWKVKRWNDPKTVTSIDTDSLRTELIRLAYPWAEQSQDEGFVDDMHKRVSVRVKSLNKDEGIWCEPFPRLYLCQKCSRLHDTSSGKCECGSTRRRGQLPFVGYHDVCGSIKTPYIRKCPVHHQRAVKLPGTASTSELVFYCPVCFQTIHRGFNAGCDCDQGGTLSFTVHRSGRVFKPVTVVLINPPKKETLLQVEQAGGGERAFEWIIDGMKGSLVEARANNDPESIKKMLSGRGFDERTIELMIAAMPVTQQEEKGIIKISGSIREAAYIEARQVALATFESRCTILDLAKLSTVNASKDLYETQYPAALSAAGLDKVELIDKFPVLTGQFGYTRGSGEPTESRLITYREPSGEYTVYGDLAQTEALFLRLSPLLIYKWLIAKSIELDQASNDRDAAISILRKMEDGEDSGRVKTLVTTLVHSYSHAFIRRAAVYAGIDRNALSELVLPHTFGFFVYAAARGDFVLGGLQALFESDLHNLLNGLVEDEQRCALDPGCEDHGSACAVCLHLGEPSCRMFNTMLSRKVLAGGEGFFDLTLKSN